MTSLSRIGRFLLPGLIAAVLIWGLLSLAEKLAVMLGVAVFLSYMFWLWRDDRRRGRGVMSPATPRSGNTAAIDHQQSSRAALGDLLRALLLLKPGRFKQSGETLAQRAEQVLQRIESDGALKKETAGFPDQLKAVTNELNRFRSLNVGRPSPEQQESMLQVEARVEALRLDLDRQLQVLEERSAPRLLKS